MSPSPPAPGLLRRAYERGAVEYGPLDLGFLLYARRVLELVARPRGPASRRWVEDLEERLERSGGADLFLAIACEEGIPGAWEAFRKRYVPRLRAVAMRRGVRGAAADQAAEGLMGDLFTPPREGSARTRLGSFSADGTLFAWLAAVLHHKLADERRTLDAARRSAEAWKDGALARRPGKTGHSSEEFDPQVATVDGETGRRFAAALRTGFGALTPRERTVVLAVFRDGRTQADVAGELGIGKPRVTRIVQAGVGRLRRAVAASFPGESWEDLDRLWMSLTFGANRGLGESPLDAQPRDPFDPGEG